MNASSEFQCYDELAFWSRPLTEEEVKNLFQLWNSALATEDPDAVAKRYASKSVLLPTVSDVPRTDYDLIKD